MNAAPKAASLVSQDTCRQVTFQKGMAALWPQV
jgi:hypothetical protein